MNSPGPKSLETVFCEAVEIEDLHARAAYLASACAGDAKLRQRVEALLAADAQAAPWPVEPRDQAEV
ncbi:MAG TPA: hypothetical protein VLT57_17015, partial [Bryobacteraceae bacterium]|nr:hypothetical protein [Bryobacteraceae bacterium]